MDKALLKETLSKILEYVEEDVTLVGSQVPLYVQELLAFKLWFHVVLIISFGCLSGAFLYLSSWAKAQKAADPHSDWWFGQYIFLVLSVVPVFFIVGNLIWVVQVLVAPRVVIVEHLRHVLQ